MFVWVLLVVVDRLNTLLIVRDRYHFMPFITVAMFIGRTQSEKDRFAEVFTENAIKIVFMKSLMEIGIHRGLDFQQN
jgi:hypothetical protein